MPTRQEVYAVLDGERDYQDSPWNPGTTSTGGKHSVGEFILFMEDYLREAKTILSGTGEPQASLEASHIIRKVGGMTVACMEQNLAPPRKPTV